MEHLPFPAIVGQEDLKSALLLNAVNRSVGGVLIRGERGTGKSSAVRGLTRVLPEIRVVEDCPFNCPPGAPHRQCSTCRDRDDPPADAVRTPLVELPLGATEDRVVGALDIERALNEGVNALEPGLLARANRGVLYVDEVNLLDDHLVDVLLDAAASGVNRVEREGVSVEHPAEFILVGTMNPEEGDLRPQFLDRFGLQVDARTPSDPDRRTTIIDVAEAFDRDPEAVVDRYADEERRIRENVEAARERYDEVTLDPDLKRRIAEVCVEAGVGGNRGDITTARCARALAALDGRTEVEEADVRTALRFALPHRIPDDPFEDGADVERLLNDHFGASAASDGGDAPRGGGGPDERTPDSGSGGQRRRGESERRKETNDSRFGSAMRELRDFFLNPADGEGDDAGQGGDPGTDGGRGREKEAGGGRHLDPIGDGTADATDRDGVDPETGLREIDPLDDRRDARIEGDEDGLTDVGKYVRARQAEAIEPGSDVAVDASLRAAARRGSTRVETSDLRLKVRKEETPALVVFAIDSSASMRAHGHIGTAKRLLTSAFQRASRRHDYVAVVSFRDETADVVVPPTDDHGRAAERLDGLPVGNRTPLPAGLVASLGLIERERTAVPDLPAIVVVLTDGRPTAAIEGDPVEETKLLAKRLRAADVRLVVLDLDRGTSGTDVCREMAEEGGGEYVPLFDLPDAERERVVLRTVESLRSRV